jgi:hypothetical protein
LATIHLLRWRDPGLRTEAGRGDDEGDILAPVRASEVEERRRFGQEMVETDRILLGRRLRSVEPAASIAEPPVELSPPFLNLSS